MESLEEFETYYTLMKKAGLTTRQAIDRRVSTLNKKGHNINGIWNRAIRKLTFTREESNLILDCVDGRTSAARQEAGRNAHKKSEVRKEAV